MKIHEIGKREYNELKKFSPDELEKELRKLETTIKVY
jgi:ribosomal protein L29